MKVCGDWVFYLQIIRGGLVAYTTSTTNYYRQHDSNTSVRARLTNIYYEEHALVATHLLSNYKIEAIVKQIGKNIEFQWKIHRKNVSIAQLDELSMPIKS